MINSVQEYFDTIHERFQPTGAPDVHLKIEWTIEGEKWRAELLDKALVNVGEGEFADADLRLTFLSADEFVQIQNGQIPMRKAYYGKLLRVAGPPMYQRTMIKWLSPDQPL